MGPRDVNVKWAAQSWQLLSEKALFWNDTRTLILSDVHLGKAEDFQAAGVAIPSQVHAADLARMESLIAQYRPTRVLILGDFVHSNRALHPHLAEGFARIRHLSSCPWILVLGNHDFPQSQRLAQWGFDRIEIVFEESGILFTHGAAEDKRPQIQGHVHPVVKIKTARDRLRLPCFLINETLILLPAFGEFTGGFEINPAETDKIYLIADSEIVSWS